MAQSWLPKTQAVSAEMALYSMLDCPPLSSFGLLTTNGEPILLLA